jgi:hypothetical protein
MISYLPALYGAYSRREARLLTLDDPTGSRITPVRIIEMNAPGGDVEMLYRSLGEWQLWTADVLESHVSYPMLALFRSQHEGQSWVTALGVLTDAATLTSACVDGAREREPYFLYRRGRMGRPPGPPRVVRGPVGAADRLSRCAARVLGPLGGGDGGRGGAGGGGRGPTEGEDRLRSGGTVSREHL